MTKVAILLSGCGVFDGSEIHESVLTFLELERWGIEHQCFAPDMAQLHVINHITGEVEQSVTRNALVESARIARGNVLACDTLDIDAFDALVIPGGFGAAKNLCDFAINNQDCEVTLQVEVFIKAFANKKKPIGFICISPVMIPKIFGEGAVGTIGNDIETAEAFNRMGGLHQNTEVGDIIIDAERHIVSTPAYMLAENITQAHKGISALIKEVAKMCGVKV
ncbi:isoprenoid biosynthesis glyoxalase ElbB [Shewanella surugensis]|uniref:Glyoxalase n=1 Tax=Shewanella surugensis TaxID=212020 RepID=A0ABT0L9T5_9GAMM|nr:isoprenoid biosynthesis glyoxalase ElbB [Shewanella surugensis]MCL1124423.1 isoprenoid biosynthesis glyoxalase ElbB [Shewanella surugensis]